MGSKSATLHFPADAEVHITGTVKDNMSGLFAFPLPWELVSTHVGLGLETHHPMSMETWTNTAGIGTFTVTFDDTSGVRVGLRGMELATFLVGEQVASG